MIINISRVKNRLIAKTSTYFPALSKRYIEAYTPWESKDIPWTPATKPLNQCHVALVTTSGVHHRQQKPFDMYNPYGDPTYRVIDRETILKDYMITHDYYDHSNADKDLNIVFPLERLREFEHGGHIGRVAERHYSFMGHIDGPYIYELINIHAQDITQKLREDGIDVVLLTPG